MVPGVRFCGAYITPSSSPYFSEAEIAQLQARSTDENTNYVIVGDLNSRFGSKVCELTKKGEKMRYNPVDQSLNDNGKKILQICEDNELFVVNNLQTEFKRFSSALTYRMRKKWISELDVCIESKDLIQM